MTKKEIFALAESLKEQNTALEAEVARLNQQLLLLRAEKFSPKSEKIHSVDSDSSQYLWIGSELIWTGTFR